MEYVVTAIIIGLAWVGVGAIVGTLVGRWLAKAQGYTMVINVEPDPEVVVRALDEETLEELAQNLTKDGAILLFYDRVHGLEYPLPKERRNAQ